jgi:hypothetical protein
VRLPRIADRPDHWFARWSDLRLAREWISAGIRSFGPRAPDPSAADLKRLSVEAERRKISTDLIYAEWSEGRIKGARGETLRSVL